MNPCRYCVAPKRAPGCKATCLEYLEWLPGDLERRETIRKNKAKNEYPYIKKRRK
jgi:hypothetical protein